MAKFNVFVFVLLTTSWLVNGQQPPASSSSEPDGTITFGRNNYTQFLWGSLPLIYTVPHGGYLQPPDIPNRTYGLLQGQPGTAELMQLMINQIIFQTGKHPFVAFCNLHPSKLDVDAPLSEGAQGNIQAEYAWLEYHTFIKNTSAWLTAQYGYGQLFSIQGQNNSNPLLNLGMLINATTLNAFNTHGTPMSLNIPYVIYHSSIRSLVIDDHNNFNSIVRGEQSLGSFMNIQGWNTVPSPANPGPGNNPYNMGGYEILTYGSSILTNGTVNAILVSAPMNVLDFVDAPNTTQQFAKDFVDASLVWFDRWYPHPIPLNDTHGSLADDPDPGRLNEKIIYAIALGVGITLIIVISVLFYCCYRANPTS